MASLRIDSSSMSLFRSIYSPLGASLSYTSLLRTLYGINDSLKRGGISAPTTESFINTMRLYESFNKPLDSLMVVHVGGTNGKGSTSFKVAEALRTAGLRTGLFVSPHIMCFRERIQVDGVLIPESAVERNLPQVLQRCADLAVPATLFEITFLLSCLHYRDCDCQAVVLEVGMGGEFDATNVASTTISAVCSVSLDHMRALGGTVIEIGRKKAGVFKRGRPCLVGPQVPLAVMQEEAIARSAHLYTLDQALALAGISEDTNSTKNSQSTTPNSTTTSVVAVQSGDTDTLNSRLSLAILCLLNHWAILTLSTTLPLSELQRFSPDSKTGLLPSPFYPVPDSCVRALSELDLSRNSLIAAAISSQPICRWEKFVVTVKIPASPPPTSLSSLHATHDNTTLPVAIPFTLNDYIVDDFEVVAHRKLPSADNGDVRYWSDTSNPTSAEKVEVDVEVVFDVGHNPAAMEALAMRIQRDYGRYESNSSHNVRVIYGASRDKDAAACLGHLLSAVPADRLHFAQSTSWRALSMEKLKAIFAQVTGGCDMHPLQRANVSKLVQDVVQLAASEKRWSLPSRSTKSKTAVIVCGTGFVLPAARNAIGITEPRDEDEIANVETKCS